MAQLCVAAGGDTSVLGEELRSSCYIRRCVQLLSPPPNLGSQLSHRGVFGLVFVGCSVC